MANHLTTWGRRSVRSSTFGLTTELIKYTQTLSASSRRHLTSSTPYRVLTKIRDGFCLSVLVICFIFVSFITPLLSVIFLFFFLFNWNEQYHLIQKQDNYTIKNYCFLHSSRFTHFFLYNIELKFERIKLALQPQLFETYKTLIQHPINNLPNAVKNTIVITTLFHHFSL